MWKKGFAGKWRTLLIKRCHNFRHLKVVAESFPVMWFVVLFVKSLIQFDKERLWKQTTKQANVQTSMDNCSVKVISKTA